MPEYKGDFFQNPDPTYNLKYAKIIDPKTEKGWGSIMTPDELRRIWLFGNSKLASINGDQYTDEMLAGIIEQYTLAIQEELQHDILPIQWRHRPENPNREREIEDYARWQELIDFKSFNNHNNLFYVRVRKPVLKLQKFQLQEPYANRLVVDLLENAQINYFTGELRSVFIGFYSGQTIGNSTNNLSLSGRSLGLRPGLSMPNAFLIDHISGYDKANRVPKDLVNFIQKVIAVHIYSRYGAGIVGGLANFSVSAGVIHESVGTTMSASIDARDKVQIRVRFADGSTSAPYRIPIGEFFESYHIQKKENPRIIYETLAVNPANIKEYSWKTVLDAVEHDSSNKPCYMLGMGDNNYTIGITGDHSLFRIEDGKLIEISGIEIEEGSYLATFQDDKIKSQRVNYKIPYRPYREKVYDLSVQDWENFIVNDYFVAHNTSAYYGADILQFQNELKEVYPKIQAKYTGFEYAIL